MTLFDAALAFDDFAAGRAPDLARIEAGMHALDALCRQRISDLDLLNAPTTLRILANGGELAVDDAVRWERAA